MNALQQYVCQNGSRLFETFFRDGSEFCLLSLLRDLDSQAIDLCTELMGSDDYLVRKIVCSLAGYLRSPPESLLSDLFQAEADRDGRLDPDSSRRLDCQSVVEDIVFSASRWCLVNRHRPQALSVLEDLIRQTCSGVYWNTCSYALVAVFKYSAGFQRILGDFGAFLKRGVPSHPCRPDLKQETLFYNNLQDGNVRTINSVESLLIRKEAIDVESIAGKPGPMQILDQVRQSAFFT